MWKVNVKSTKDPKNNSWCKYNTLQAAVNRIQHMIMVYNIQKPVYEDHDTILSITIKPDGKNNQQRSKGIQEESTRGGSD